MVGGASTHVIGAVHTMCVHSGWSSHMKWN